jgi:succinyl-diaminopimelate desuccinylase
MIAKTESVQLAQQLLRFPSVNPPGNEADCIAYLADMLAAAGLSVETHAFAPRRPSIVARAVGAGAEPPLCFTGHVDVVPLGEIAWTASPFAGEIVDGKLFGRGSSDMKGGVAAFVAATLQQVARDRKLRRGITLIITSGEETGCEGAFHLARVGALGSAGLLIVAEPSSNLPIIAHKGSLRLSVRVRGKTAHSSMPELGDNAVDKIAEMICRLRSHRFNAPPDALLGPTTAAVTTIKGGLNINSVPDAASFTVDIRTLPHQRHADVLSEMQTLFGAEADIAVVTDFPGFATGGDDPALSPLMAVLAERNGARPPFRGAPYFTDASALVPALNQVATVVIGPGEAEQAHKTDEYCYVHRIETATEIYYDLIEAMCR